MILAEGLAILLRAALSGHLMQTASNGTIRGIAFWQWINEGQVAPGVESYGKGLYGVSPGDVSWSIITNFAKVQPQPPPNISHHDSLPNQATCLDDAAGLISGSSCLSGRNRVASGGKIVPTEHGCLQALAGLSATAGSCAFSKPAALSQVETCSKTWVRGIAGTG